MKFAVKPNKIDFSLREDGIAEVFLHKNIVDREEIYTYADDEGVEQSVTQTGWDADEVQIVGNYTYEEVEENFDELWKSNTSSGVDIEDLACTVESMLELQAELYSVVNELLGTEDVTDSEEGDTNADE